jgi:hypothetical protein
LFFSYPQNLLFFRKNIHYIRKQNLKNSHLCFTISQNHYPVPCEENNQNGLGSQHHYQAMKTTASILKLWVALAATMLLMCGIIYITVQQSYRQGANDPQFQIAEDAVNAIALGVNPESLVSDPPKEISSSLSPYLIIYGPGEKPVASGAVLNGNVPTMPSGVLKYVKEHGEDVITWKPREGIRHALVIQKTKGEPIYFVVAGRSLKKTEERIALLGRQIELGWLFSVVILFLVLFVLKFVSKAA